MDIYGMVTERIIGQLESGRIPWHKPWVSCNNGTFNRISKKPYSILNRLLLIHEGEYATYNQWQQLGGKIKKGEKAEFVVFWKMQEEIRKDEDGKEYVKQIPLLRYYNVFHISQVEGVKPLQIETQFETQPIERAEELLRGYTDREGIKLYIGKSDQAFYNPLTDSITLPEISQFKQAEEFYSTGFHEAIHSTLKACRCNREEENKDTFFGSEGYSKEELVAEIGSAAILNFLGIETPETFRNSAAYIQNWVQVLKNDKKFIVSASSKAEKAVNFILDM